MIPSSLPFSLTKYLHHTRRGRVLYLHKAFSSNTRTRKNLDNDDNNNGGGDNTLATLGAAQPPAQPFIKTRLTAGEWDPDQTDPLYRPKFKSTARIISADDFAARPTVGFSGEFETLQDAMVTLSWLDQNEHAHIYKLYMDMMLSAESSVGVTSHEYVMRVIAQQYNITAERVAAVVQLQHNEEQMLQNEPDRKLLTETANRMDTMIKQEINDAYETFKLRKPDSFTEDPVGVNGLQDRKKWRIVDDVYDVDQMTQNATVREDQKARLIIDGHVYIEDADEESLPVPMDKDCRKLLKQKERVAADLARQEEIVHQQRAKKAAVEPVWRSTNGEGVTRERWKFIAQTVNTRELKKSRVKHRSYVNNSVANTLVEHNGILRNGTMADLKSVAWKPIRHPQEHVYAGAKKGWLDRVNRHAAKTWGKAPPRAATLGEESASPPLGAETMADNSAGATDAMVVDESKADSIPVTDETPSESSSDIDNADESTTPNAEESGSNAANEPADSSPKT